MKIELRKIESITPYEKNPRLNDDAVDAVAESIREFGFRQPVVVDGDGVIICGHTRWKAAKQLALAKVPVHVATDLTPEQVKAYRIADNKTAELAEWDFDQLRIEIADLQDADFDLDVLAFNDDELSRLLNGDNEVVTDGQTDPDSVPEPPDEPVSVRGEIYQLGNHRLMCGDSADAEDLDKLLDGQPIHLVNTDPPYNVKVEPRSNNAIAAGLSSFTAPGPKQKALDAKGLHHAGMDLERHPEKAHATHTQLRPKDRPLENDFVTDEEFDRLLDAWFGNIARVLVPGHGFYIWGGYANVGNYPPFLKKHKLYFSQAVIWDKQHPVLTRKDYMGAHEWCQPPDTKVMTGAGNVPISSLRDGDEVITFAQHSAAIVGYRKGPKVKVGRREYAGSLYGVSVAGRTTWATDGHIFNVRLLPEAAGMWCVYLMRKGRWWRVGKSKLLGSWGLGVRQRLIAEQGEEAWVLSTHGTDSEATCAEQLVSVRYGIPTTFWREYHNSSRTGDQITEIYEGLDLVALHRCAQWALADHNRDLAYPFVSAAKKKQKFGRAIPFLIRACNLLPAAMEVPVPKGEGPSYDWMPVRHVDVQRYEGPVYSLDVEKYHHYVADGIVTHNCFYGWKEGAAHRFFGPNNATDLWHIKKVSPQKMVHLTEKCVELAVRAIQYSSQRGENVLDLFGGSGSTLIGCEQTGRHSFLMEIDPLYCDVIRKRWAEFVHGEGCDWEALTPRENAPAETGA